MNLFAITQFMNLFTFVFLIMSCFICASDYEKSVEQKKVVKGFDQVLIEGVNKTEARIPRQDVPVATPGGVVHIFNVNVIVNNPNQDVRLLILASFMMVVALCVVIVLLHLKSLTFNRSAIIKISYH